MMKPKFLTKNIAIGIAAFLYGTAGQAMQISNANPLLIEISPDSFTSMVAAPGISNSSSLTLYVQGDWFHDNEYASLKFYDSSNNLMGFPFSVQGAFIYHPQPGYIQNIQLTLGTGFADLTGKILFEPINLATTNIIAVNYSVTRDFVTYTKSYSLDSVPIPGSLPLLTSGLAGLVLAKRRKPSKA